MLLKRSVGERPANEDRTQLVHNSGTLTIPAGSTWVNPPSGPLDQVTVKVPSGGAHALVSAVVGITKLTPAGAPGDCHVWAWPIITPDGSGLEGVFGGGSSGSIDTMLMLGSTGRGLGIDRASSTGGTLVGQGYDTPLGANGNSRWSEVSVSGSGNFGDQIDAGNTVQIGGTTIWLPEGERTLSLIYWANNCSMGIHSRVLAVTLL